jgi:hypothetical protein
MIHQPFGPPAIIFAFLAVPLVLGLVPPNRYYGVRTAAAMASPDVWKRVNRVAGWGVLAASGIYVTVARVWPYSRAAPGELGVMILHIASFAGPLFGALIMAGRYGRRLG